MRRSESPAKVRQLDEEIGWSRAEFEAEFDRALAEILEQERERERRGEPPPRTGPLSPEVAQAVAALRAIFEGNHHLTADLSFDQVYAKALPHLITIWKDIMREQDVD